MKVACALINANTGKVINAAVAKVTELNSIYDAQETPSMQIQTNGNVIRIQSASAESIIAHAYTIDGRLLGAASHCAQADIYVGHYHGIVIVKAQARQQGGQCHQGHRCRCSGCLFIKTQGGIAVY